MFCLNAKTGKQIWWAPEVLHFVAAGKQRVYAADKLGRLRILDARNGATLDSLPTSAMPIKISNSQTDRIYLATEGGLVQCLREVAQTNPVAYNEGRMPLWTQISPSRSPSRRSNRGPRATTAAHRGSAEKSTPKKDDAGGLGDDPGEKPAKAAKGKAAADKAKAAVKGKKDADAAGSDLFGN